MSDLVLDVCAEAIDVFPLGGSDESQLRATVPYAIQAPSNHNTQPWNFRFERGALELWADRTRALPVVDPDDRELVISCGAALFNIRVTLRRFGREPLVTVLPDPQAPDLLARIRLGGEWAATDQDRTLFDALPLRRTFRFPFLNRTVPEGLVRGLADAATAEGGWLCVLQGPARREDLVEAIVDGDRRQMTDRSFRRELAAWVHPSRTRTHDGMPTSTLGVQPLLAAVTPLAIRTFDLGNGRAAWDQDLARMSPVLAVLGTPGDTAVDWLAAGQALQHVLLLAAADGVYGSFLNQPIEVPALRARIRGLTAQTGAPQMVLRLGYGHPGTRAPRRSPADVLA